MNTTTFPNKATHSNHMSRIWLVSGAVATCVLFVANDYWQSAHERMRDSNCRGQLKQIGLALLNYHTEYGSFPMRVTRDSTGTELHSWRTLLLRFGSRSELVQECDLLSAWDAPENCSLVYAAVSGDFYCCPISENTPQQSTYFAISGRETAWPDSKAVTLSMITDPVEQTILVIETKPAGNVWCEPRDIAINDVLSAEARPNHEMHFNALFADFKVRRIRRSVSPEVLRALCTIAGGEEIREDDWLYVE